MTASAPGAASAAATRPEFKALFRRWRRHRKLSQLDLALSAGVSQRHVSWLETGRSRPSREMVIRLCEAMEIPLRERNALLQAAGYAAVYAERRLDEPDMRPVLDAIRHVLDHHAPYPAVAVDRAWNVLMQNDAAGGLLALGKGAAALTAEGEDPDTLNLALLTLHPDGLRRFIVNWAQAAPPFVRRLRSEAISSGDPTLHDRFERYITLAGPVDEGASADDGLLPILPLELDFDGLRLKLFSIITTIGTPQDVTADELRIEAFFPADEATERFFRGAAT